MISEQIPIRSIQHWLYCPHRWGLMEVDCAWAENYFVTKSNIMHENVHSDKVYSSKAKRSYTAIKVYNDLPKYGIYGVTDCLEIADGRYIIVEYKPTQPKNEQFYHEDMMQVFTQKACVDYMFGCNSEGYLYYADTRKRVKLPLEENFVAYQNELLSILVEIRYNIRNGIIPPIRNGQKCNGCSMKDLCMPNQKKHEGLRQSISKLLEEKL